MGKNTLHSLLAVENDLKGVATKIKGETLNTFTKKDDHFDGLTKTFRAFDEEMSSLDSSDTKEVVTTVEEKLQYMHTSVVKGMNAVISKEETNASGKACASLVVNGTDFGTLSATSLLALEKELTALRTIYSAIPTLDPVKNWTIDEMGERGIYKTGEVKTFRTQKTKDFKVVYEATKEHPAQIVEVVKDKTIGENLTVYRSGKISPLTKSKLLAKIDSIIIAVKKARSSANEAEVVKSTIGDTVMGYINSVFLEGN